MNENLNNVPSETEPKQIPLDEIVVDEMFRVREREDEWTINDYTDQFEQYIQAKEDSNVGYPFPAVHVWRREGKYVLIAGFHRFHAAKKAGMETILACEFPGSEDEAFEFAVRDNSKNGLRLSKGDLGVCIAKAFLRYPDHSIRVISELTGASKSRCHEIKMELEQTPGNENMFPEKTKGKDGKTHSAKKAKRKPQASPESQEPNVLQALEQPEALTTQDEPKESSTSQESPVESTALPSDGGDEFDIIHWEHLTIAPVEKQIERFLYAFTSFGETLEVEYRVQLCKKVMKWIERQPTTVNRDKQHSA